MNKKPDPEEKALQEIIDKMSQWQQANPQATLTDIEEAVEVELAKLRKQLVEEMVQAKGEVVQEVPVCPDCGEKMAKNGKRKRKLKGKEGETVAFKRQQWRCLTCGQTLFPPG